MDWYKDGMYSEWIISGRNFLPSELPRYMKIL